VRSRSGRSLHPRAVSPTTSITPQTVCLGPFVASTKPSPMRKRTCTFVTVAMRVLQRVHREWNERARAFLAEAEAEAGASRRIRM